MENIKTKLTKNDQPKVEQMLGNYQKALSSAKGKRKRQLKRDVRFLNSLNEELKSGNEFYETKDATKESKGTFTSKNETKLAQKKGSLNLPLGKKFRFSKGLDYMFDQAKSSNLNTDKQKKSVEALTPDSNIVAEDIESSTLKEKEQLPLVNDVDDKSTIKKTTIDLGDQNFKETTDEILKNIEKKNSSTTDFNPVLILDYDKIDRLLEGFDDGDDFSTQNQANIPTSSIDKKTINVNKENVNQPELENSIKQKLKSQLDLVDANTKKVAPVATTQDAVESVQDNTTDDKTTLNEKDTKPTNTKPSSTTTQANTIETKSISFNTDNDLYRKKPRDVRWFTSENYPNEFVNEDNTPDTSDIAVARYKNRLSEMYGDKPEIRNLEFENYEGVLVPTKASEAFIKDLKAGKYKVRENYIESLEDEGYEDAAKFFRAQNNKYDKANIELKQNENIYTSVTSQTPIINVNKIEDEIKPKPTIDIQGQTYNNQGSIYTPSNEVINNTDSFVEMSSNDLSQEDTEYIRYTAKGLATTNVQQDKVILPVDEIEKQEKSIRDQANSIKISAQNMAKVYRILFQFNDKKKGEGRPDMRSLNLVNGEIMGNLNNSVKTDQNLNELYTKGEFTEVINQLLPSDFSDKEVIDSSSMPINSEETFKVILALDNPYSYHKGANYIINSAEEIKRNPNIVIGKDVDGQPITIFDGFDINGDGKVTNQEIYTFRKNSFKMFKQQTSIEQELNKAFNKVKQTSSVQKKKEGGEVIKLQTGTTVTVPPDEFTDRWGGTWKKQKSGKWHLLNSKGEPLADTSDPKKTTVIDEASAKEMSSGRFPVGLINVLSMDTDNFSSYKTMSDGSSSASLSSVKSPIKNTSSNINDVLKSKNNVPLREIATAAFKLLNYETVSQEALKRPYTFIKPVEGLDPNTKAEAQRQIVRSTAALTRNQYSDPKLNLLNKSIANAQRNITNINLAAKDAQVRQQDRSRFAQQTAQLNLAQNQVDNQNVQLRNKARLLDAQGRANSRASAASVFDKYGAVKETQRNAEEATMMPTIAQNQLADYTDTKNMQYYNLASKYAKVMSNIEQSEQKEIQDAYKKSGVKDPIEDWVNSNPTVIQGIQNKYNPLKKDLTVRRNKDLENLSEHYRKSKIMFGQGLLNKKYVPLTKYDPTEWNKLKTDRKYSSYAK